MKKKILIYKSEACLAMCWKFPDFEAGRAYKKKPCTSSPNIFRLCVSAGKLAWILYCDVVCLNSDGNLFDACLLSVMAALAATTLPTVTMDDTTKVVTVHTRGEGDGGVGRKDDGVKRWSIGVQDIPGECFGRVSSVHTRSTLTINGRVK